MSQDATSKRVFKCVKHFFEISFIALVVYNIDKHILNQRNAIEDIKGEIGTMQPNEV